MAVTCGPTFGLCRIRVTRVDSLGNVIAGDNAYVTDAAISLAVAVNKETGNTFSQRNGCGCSIARFRAPDIFNWFDLTFVDAELEPVLQEFLLGADPITDGGDTVGIAYPGALACAEQQPAVAFEFWAQRIVGSAQDTVFPWIHGVFPYSLWSLGDNTFEEDFGKPQVVGFTRTNANWGDGPYDDGPPDSTPIDEGGWWFTDIDPPDPECAAQAVTSSS
jgi:hypothetical protein